MRSACKGASVIKVLLVDDHSLFREGLKQLLETERDVEVVGEAGDGLEAQRLIADLQPQVVLMDIHMPISDGVSVTREVVRHWPEIGVVVLTMHHEDGYVFQAVRAGARGYLLKSSRAADVAAAIRAVASGASLLDPVMAGKLITEFCRLSSKARAEEGVGGLTETELRMLRLLASGLSNREIADKMCLAESTVKNRLSVLFEKIAVQDRTQAAIYAITHGLLPEQAPSFALVS